MELKRAVIVLTFNLLLSNCKIYDRCELAKELKNTHNIPEKQLATWICIAKHESHFNTSAMNRGSGDHGIFQISEIFWCSPPGYACGLPCELLRDEDLEDDVICAKRIHREHTILSGDGFNAWVVYNLYCKNEEYVKSLLSDCIDDERNVINYRNGKNNDLNNIDETNFEETTTPKFETEETIPPTFTPIYFWQNNLDAFFPKANEVSNENTQQITETAIPDFVEESTIKKQLQISTTQDDVKTSFIGYDIRENNKETFSGTIPVFIVQNNYDNNFKVSSDSTRIPETKTTESYSTQATYNELITSTIQKGDLPTSTSIIGAPINLATTNEQLYKQKVFEKPTTETLFTKHITTERAFFEKDTTKSSVSETKKLSFSHQATTMQKTLQHSFKTMKNKELDFETDGGDEKVLKSSVRLNEKDNNYLSTQIPKTTRHKTAKNINLFETLQNADTTKASLFTTKKPPTILHFTTLRSSTSSNFNKNNIFLFTTQIPKTTSHKTGKNRNSFETLQNADNTKTTFFTTKRPPTTSHFTTLRSPTSSSINKFKNILLSTTPALKKVTTNYNKATRNIRPITTTRPTYTFKTATTKSLIHTTTITNRPTTITTKRPTITTKRPTAITKRLTTITTKRPTTITTKKPTIITTKRPTTITTKRPITITKRLTTTKPVTTTKRPFFHQNTTKKSSIFFSSTKKHNLSNTSVNASNKNEFTTKKSNFLRKNRENLQESSNRFKPAYQIGAYSFRLSKHGFQIIRTD